VIKDLSLSGIQSYPLALKGDRKTAQIATLLLLDKYWHHCSIVGIATLREGDMLCQEHSRNNLQPNGPIESEIKLRQRPLLN